MDACARSLRGSGAIRVGALALAAVPALDRRVPEA